MKHWTIGQVARLLGVKPHVIRYWESELPLLSPPKGLSGRREYSGNEVRLLLRFRHLLYDRKFTVEGAKRVIWEELGTGDPDLAARFAEIRGDLIDALSMLRREDMGEGNDPRSAGDARNAGDARSAREQLEAIGQGHLFAHWEARPAQLQQRLLDDIAQLDMARVRELAALLSGAGADRTSSPSSIDPGPYVPLSASRSDRAALEAGEEIIRNGRTALLTVAGGQGSRLGFEGPKGMFPVTPLRRLTLFALFAEKLLAARRHYGARIPWLIMTSPLNHAATIDYFEREAWFGLGRESVIMFAQGTLPSFSPEGRLIMAPDGGLFVNPNGHGGVIDALRRSGSLEALREQGVEHLFYFQVDNPLVRVPDPVFLGWHCREGAEISAKVVEKAYPDEKLGVIVSVGGKPSIIEYSDLELGLMHARGDGGRLRFSQGSIAIHILDVAFLADAGLVLPLHFARKKAHILNPTPNGVEIVEGEAVKFELFIFDAIPRAARALFFETARIEEFAPLKNREGNDSIQTCLSGQIEQAAQWLSSCGVEVPRDAEGKSRHAIEISPLFALDPVVLAARRGSLKDRIDEDMLLA